MSRKYWGIKTIVILPTLCWLLLSVVAGNQEQEDKNPVAPCLAGRAVSVDHHLKNQIYEIIQLCQLSEKQMTKLKVGIKGVKNKLSKRNVGKWQVILKDPRQDESWVKLTKNVLTKEQAQTFAKHRDQMAKDLVASKKKLKASPNSRSAQIDTASAHLALYLGLTKKQRESIRKLIDSRFDEADSKWNRSIGKLIVSNQKAFAEILEGPQREVLEKEKELLANFGVEAFSIEKWRKPLKAMKCNLCHQAGIE